MTQSGRRIQGIGYAISSNGVTNILLWLKAGLYQDCQFFNLPTVDTYELSFALEEGTEVRYSFIVHEDPNQNIDVTFFILAPTGNAVAFHERVKGGEGRIVAQESGRYTLVVDNSFSIFTSKDVTLFYGIMPP